MRREEEEENSPLNLLSSQILFVLCADVCLYCNERRDRLKTGVYAGLTNAQKCLYAFLCETERTRGKRNRR